MSESLIKSKALKDVVQTDVVRNRLKEIMGTRAPQFAAALVQIVNQSWSLQKCEPNSVIGAALTAAALDLSIDPNLGEAHIVPYGDKAQFQIGYIGFNQLAMRSGQYKNLGWKVVHKGELDHYDELSGELEVNSDHPDEEVIGYAAKFKLINGFERGIYWTKERCFKHAEKYSKAYVRGLKSPDKRDSVWWTDPDRACLKTVIKLLLKLWGPKSIQMQKALKMDDGAVVDVDTEQVSYVDNPGDTTAASPDFGKEEETKVIESPKEPPAPLKSANKPKPEPSADYTKVKPILDTLAASDVTESEVIKFLKEMGTIDSKTKTLEDIASKEPEAFNLLVEQVQDIINRIKEVK